MKKTAKKKRESHRIKRIYSRTGDQGFTGLANGMRVHKSTDRIDAIGHIDELNSMIGLLIEFSTTHEMGEHLQMIQHRLFDVGGELAIPDSIAIRAADTTGLETLILQYSEAIPPLKKFILPGGSISGGLFHLARSICRRAERTIARLAESATVNPHTLCYLNRLSDLLFVLARTATLQAGKKEIEWEGDRFKK